MAVGVEAVGVDPEGDGGAAVGEAEDRDEAREIVELYEREIEGRYEGCTGMDLETYLSTEIVLPLID